MVGQQLVTINRHLHVNAHMYSKCNTSSLTYYIIDVCRRPLRPKPSKHYKQHRPRRGKAAAAPITSMRAVVLQGGGGRRAAADCAWPGLHRAGGALACNWRCQLHTRQQAGCTSQPARTKRTDTHAAREVLHATRAGPSMIMCVTCALMCHSLGSRVSAVVCSVAGGRAACASCCCAH